MNTRLELLSRLLRMYPVSVLKEYFNITGMYQLDAINDIVHNVAEQDIKDFAVDNLNFTKQHVYIYQHTPHNRGAALNLTDFPYEVIGRRGDRINYEITCTPVTSYQVGINAPFEVIEINFLQPVKIKVQGNHLTIQTTIVEKNLESYVPTDKEFLYSKPTTKEDVIIRDILDFFSGIGVNSICDINRGIKQLCMEDAIDFKVSKYKTDSSTATEVMDENLTLKRHRPATFNEAMQSPLSKGVYRYMINNDYLTKTFAADASNGQLSFATYPTTVNQIENVVSEILAKN